MNNLARKAAITSKKAPITSKKAPRRNRSTYTCPPKETVLMIAPGGTMIETTMGGEEGRISPPRRFTAIDIEMPDGRHISIQDLIENYRG